MKMNKHMHIVKLEQGCLRLDLCFRSHKSKAQMPQTIINNTETMITASGGKHICLLFFNESTNIKMICL